MKSTRELKNMTVPAIKVCIEQEFYIAGRIFEQLEDAHLISGNGHHMAQAVAKHAVELFQKRLVDSKWTKE